MALTSTIFKVELSIADMDRNHYQDYSLTLAQHPSETAQRMMTRLVAFALNAADNLSFTKGISTEGEPDLWQRELTGEISLWIDLGQPDEKRLRKAAGRAAQVIVYPYATRAAGIWWRREAERLQRFTNLQVIHLPEAACRQLEQLTRRTMQLQCTIQDGQLWLSDGQQMVHLEPEVWKP